MVWGAAEYLHSQRVEITPCSQGFFFLSASLPLWLLPLGTPPPEWGWCLFRRWGCHLLALSLLQNR